MPKGEDNKISSDRHLITMIFPKPQNIKKANLVFNGGTALWGSNMIRKMLELRGDSLDSWYWDINNKGIEYNKLLHFTFREELYVLKIHIKNNNQWTEAGFLSGGGPLITEDRIIPLDLSKIEGEDLVIRIEPPPGFWQIDYIAMDYESTPVQSNFILPLTNATDHNDQNITESLAQADDVYYKMPEVGDWFKSDFSAPDRLPDMDRSVFLEIKGFYELHIDKTQPEQTDLIESLMNTPGEIVKYSIERYYEWYNQQLALKEPLR
jgi:hypothetical protein